ncbi:MAG TPA: AraC family transcriptional regulator [Bryobacteraceae bacterium]|nr:AraC family transcriptional regulator [Bryobacteraceae bacterium]
MAKIALAAARDLEKPGNSILQPALARRVLASGNGCSVSDVICRAGPRDHPSEEQHSNFCIAVVVNGSFQYRSGRGRELMTPGSLLLGNAGQYFECAHEHGVGDRCISFAYEPQRLENLAVQASLPIRKPSFSALRLPPIREMSGVIARTRALLAEADRSPRTGEQTTIWHEIATDLAVRALELTNGSNSNHRSSPASEGRVTRIVRLIDSRPAAKHDLASLAQEARLSPYHFLRVFQRLTGLTPHQYVLRARLCHAAAKLLLEPARVLDIALDCGFQDISNFNHSFRAEFGLSPRLFRARARRS